MKKARSVDRSDGVTDLHGALNRLGRLHRRSSSESLLDRLALNPFHPEAYRVADPLCAMNRDDIRMAHAREEPAFLDNRGRTRGSGVRLRRQELQRNFAIEPAVPPAV